MICPHCAKNLLQRDRSGRTCSSCHKGFALDPKIDGPGLHDVRIRKLVERITDGRQLVCTVDQLRWAEARRGRPAPEFRGSRESAGCLSVLGGVPLIAALVVLHGTAMVLALLAAVIFLGMAVNRLVLSRIPAPPSAVRPAWDARGFHDRVAVQWKRVYGVLPAGLVEDDLVEPGPPPADPAFVLLCPSRTVTRFLHANGYPRRHRALLVHALREVPDGPPVVVLHDASPEGCLLVAEARAAQPGRRVLDAGLPARAVLSVEDKCVVLRDPDRAEELRVRLERDVPGLTTGEREWYAEGWWSPLAALPPKRLMAVAERAAERAPEPPARVPLQKGPAPAQPEDPAETRRRALAVGFLTWPEPTEESPA
ncbi:hypothetical protein ACFVHB_04580 [Kitasatospora sp. NPDC127111]|uniref:hypothetical protein n=1 Tax=Kitasatospora sp. NPDC127111 TaxID=3345363 RepID=UPI00363D2609